MLCPQVMSKKFNSKTSTPFKKVLGVFKSTRSSKSSVDSLTETTCGDIADITVIANPKPITNMSRNKLEFRDLIKLIRPFDGAKASYKHFVQDCERVMRLADVRTAELVLHYIVSMLSSLRLDFVLVHSKGTWNDLKAVLDEHFLMKLDASEILQQLTQIRRGTEPVFDYYNKFTILLNDYTDSISDLYPDPQVMRHIVHHAEKIALDSFVKGLNVELKSTVLIKDPQTLQEAYKVARNFEDKMKDKPASDADKLAETIKNLLKVAEKPSSSDSFNKPTIYRTEVIQCQICHKVGHGAKTCYSVKNRENDSSKAQVCQLCNKAGHSAPQCYSLKENNGQKKSESSFSKGASIRRPWFKKKEDDKA